MMGRHHARVAREIDGVKLVAVVDELGDSYGVAGDLPLLEKVEDLIAYGVDAAVVAIPTQFHEKVGLELATAGIHALIEKPIAHSFEAGDALFKAFESRGLVGVVGHVERFNPALIELRKRLENGELGRVFQIHTRRQGPFPARVADVGVIKDLGSHDIDLTSWLANSKFSKVSAQTAFQSGREHEDMVTISARLENGIITSHLVNWLTPFKERVTAVTGERGTFVADTLTADLTYFENGTIASEWEAMTAFRGVSEGTVTRFALDKREPLHSEHEAFRDRILGRPNHAVSLLEGLEVLRVCEAAIDSSRLGRFVSLENIND
jgi:predicted dehydrogenase